MAVKNLQGQRFGRLVVANFVRVNEKHRAIWECNCDCGNTTFSDTETLTRGLKRSCGCLRDEYLHSRKTGRVTHGKTKSRLYAVWSGMKQRCNYPGSDSYQRYGGRGIRICDEWNNDFSSFEKWAYDNGYDEFAKRGECTIDRIDNDGNYEPSNCRWVSMKVQYHNRDVPKPLTEIAAEHDLTYDAVHQRMKKGMSLEEALKKPMRKNCYMTLDGETKTASEWSRIKGIPLTTLFYRVNHGWSDERALTTQPVPGGGRLH